MKRRAQMVLAGLVLPLSGVLPRPPMPWEIGPAIDNALYQVEWSLAFYAWQPHTTMMAISHVFANLSDSLTTNMLPMVVDFVIQYIKTSNIFGIGVALALVLAGLSMLGSFIDLSIVDLKQVFRYAILISLVLAYGASAMQSVEILRGNLASALYENAYSAIASGSGFSGVFAAPAETDPWARFELEDRAPPRGRTSAYDVALSALESSAMEAVLPSLPSGFESRYFPHPSIASLNESRRSNAIQAGWQGIVRLVLSYPLSVVSLVETGMEVLFAIAGMILLASMPFALVFGLFRPTDAIVGRLLQQYLTFFVNYVVVSMLISIGVSGLVSAAATRSMTMMAAGAVLSAIFYWFGVKSAWGAAKSSFTAVTGSVAQALDVEEPVGAAGGALRTAGGMVVGAGGAVAAAAAGMPQLAPAALKAGQSFSELGADERDAERRKGRIRAGLGVFGGMAMQGTPIQGPATALTAMRSFGTEGGMDEMLTGLEAADATMVGLSSRSPFGAVYALDRARRRRERLENQYGDKKTGKQVGDDVGRGGAGQRGAKTGSATASPATNTGAAVGLTFRPKDDSPWKQEIEQAMLQFGDHWAQEVANAVRETADQLRDQGMTEKEVARHFVDDEREPSFNSAHGRTIFDNLGEETKRLLANESEALRAARGIIGEEVMPTREITREELADAVAYAVNNAGNETGAAARAVAESLGVAIEELGAQYPAYNSLVKTVRKTGGTGEDVRRQLLDPSGDFLTENTKKLTRFMPQEIIFKETKLKDQ